MERITEDYCSFELSKLLKEKGFSNGSDRGYTKKIASEINVEEGEEIDLDDDRDNTWEIGEVTTSSDYIVNNGSGDYSNKVFYQCERPTHNVVIKWLRKKYNTYLEIYREKQNVYFCFNNNDVAKVLIAEGSSPEEATEKGITEVLNIL